MNHCTGLQGKRCSCGQWHEFDDFDPSKPNVLASAVKYGLIVFAMLAIGAAPLFFR